MDDIIFRISRHYITGTIGLLGLGAATYFIRRYLSNSENTTNRFYTRSDEMDAPPSLVANSYNARKVYIFWNGSFNSTYLLLDYLQQDYIVQPLYIERYTIRKSLEHDRLQKYTAEYRNAMKSGNTYTSIKCSPEIIDYLEDVARMKRQQEIDISQITMLRRIITNQHSEFQYNLLPTRYITVIEKDLTHTQTFYDTIKSLEIPPLDYIGIELFEQASRYITHIPPHSSKQKIIIGYSQDSHLARIITNIIEKIKNVNQANQANQANQTNQSSRPNGLIEIELPLANISNDVIRYLATQKIHQEVMRFLNPLKR